MHLAGSAKRVILDASIPRRFSEASLLHALMGFLKKNAYVTDAVRDELDKVVGSSIPGTQELTLILPYANWPIVIETPLELWPDVLRIKAELDTEDDPPSKHLGEITTVLVAVERDIDLAAIDDRAGKALARARGLPTISTAILAAEMTVRGVLTPQQGFLVYDLATPDGVGAPEFADATRRVQEALDERRGRTTAP